MQNRNAAKPTSNEIEQAVRKVLTAFAAEQRMFFSVEVSNEVKRQGCNAGHAALAPITDSLIAQGVLPGYVHSTVPMMNGRITAELYHPKSATEAEIAKHNNRIVRSEPPGQRAQVRQTPGRRARQMVSNQCRFAPGLYTGSPTLETDGC